MPNRAPDWIGQARCDLEQARDSRAAARHEWACFAAQQAAEKAVKILRLNLGAGGMGTRCRPSTARVTDNGHRRCESHR